VYVATADADRFVERRVQIGAASGESVEVVYGLKVGERLVTEGSFYVRSEAARQRTGGLPWRRRGPAPCTRRS